MRLSRLFLPVAAALSLAACPPLKGDKTLPPCEGDADCEGETRCLQKDDALRVCAPLCGADNPCPAGEACVEVEGRAGCFPIVDDLEDGEPCEDHTECASGRCVIAPHMGEGGVCVDECSEDQPCTRPLVCVTLEIGAKVCLEALPDGEACTTPEICEGGRCITDTDGETRLCTRACAPDGSCAEGWACVRDTEGNPICMPNVDERAAGEACTSARECASGRCAVFADFGQLCADPCAEDGSCPEGTICWEVDEGPDLCGPIP